MHQRSSGPAARLASGLRAILGRRCGALNDYASSCGRGHCVLKQNARKDQPEGHGHSNWSIALCGPVASASGTSRAAAPTSATGCPEKPARAGSEFFVNRHRRMNGTRFCDVSLEFYEIGMGHDAVGNIDLEAVGGIAGVLLRHEDEIPGAVIG